jgi:integrase
VVRRLARRKHPQRQTSPQGFSIEESSRSVRKADACRTGEETPPQTTALAIAQAWAEAAPITSHHHQAAAQLARALAQKPGAIPEASILELQADWKARYAQNTRSSRLFALKKIAAVIDEKLGTSLRLAVPKAPRQKPRNVTITPADLQNLLQIARPHMRLFVSLMAFAALRFAEAHEIGWENYDEEKQTLTIAGKGGAIRTIPAPPEAVELLRLTPKGTGSFISLLRGRATTKQWTRREWVKLKRKAGVPENINPHDLRRTAAVGIYRRTKDVYAAKELLRHEALSSTAHYLAPYDVEALQKVRNDMLRGAKGPPN